MGRPMTVDIGALRLERFAMGEEVRESLVV